MNADEIRYLLPDVFQSALGERSPLTAILHVMEAFHAPVEAEIGRFPDRLDPRRTSDGFIPLLARWVDLDRLFDERVRGRDVSPKRLLPTGLERLRELVAMAAVLSQWRGTALGLRLFLETATGLKGFQIDEHVLGEDGRRRPYHVRIGCPAAAQAYEHLVRRIVVSEKPAYVTYELQFQVSEVGGARGKDI
jgi:phage tail-like protein